MEIKTKPVEVTMFEFSLTEQEVEYLSYLLDKLQFGYGAKPTIYRDGKSQALSYEDVRDFRYDFGSELHNALVDVSKQREAKAKAAATAAREEKKASAPKKAGTKSAPAAAAAKPRKANGTWTCPGCGRQIDSMGKGRHTSTCQKYIAQAKAKTATPAPAATESWRTAELLPPGGDH